MIQVAINGQLIPLTEETINLIPMGVSPYDYIPPMYQDTT